MIADTDTAKLMDLGVYQWGREMAATVDDRFVYRLPRKKAACIFEE